ncbi:beta-lactamase family protein [Dactylosporangium roseum]|uniref:Beta-lactamase family protein n=1 Tax=Dactylosporangium roseum TaxID=47989 RepID=A0ABY5YXG2_9ACTN|nr:serine hydrolase domain-containing protein [Dactylosporangium roseum]UWZ34435.1 beta-lactamase family protein [Dactylosporangium roseum]
MTVTRSVALDAAADPSGRLSAALEALTHDGELGVQVCVVRDGTVLADVTAGAHDAAEPPLTRRSLLPVFSVSKGVLSGLALVALSRGALELDQPVRTVWPEFAANGKQDVTVRHVLLHTAGIPQMPAGVTVEQMCDWSAMVERVAALELLWPAGAVRAYHALTYGWLLGETVRRALDVRADVATLVRRELLDPLGVAEFWFGIPDAVEPRVHAVVRDPRRPPDPGSLLARALPERLAVSQAVYGRPDVRRAVIPAVNGITNARALATLYAGIAGQRGVAGPVVDPAWVRRAARPLLRETDRTIGSQVVHGLGFYVGNENGWEWDVPFAAGSATFGHPGSGGSLAWGNVRTGTGFAITRVRLTGAGWRDPAIQRLVRLLGEVATAVEEER